MDGSQEFGLVVIAAGLTCLSLGTLGTTRPVPASALRIRRAARAAYAVAAAAWPKRWLERLVR